MNCLILALLAIPVLSLIIVLAQPLQYRKCFILYTDIDTAVVGISHTILLCYHEVAEEMCIATALKSYVHEAQIPIQSKYLTQLPARLDNESMRGVAATEAE